MADISNNFYGKTVIERMFDIHDNGEVNIYTNNNLKDRPAQRQDKAEGHPCALPEWAVSNRATAMFGIVIEEGLLQDDLKPSVNVPKWKLAAIAYRIAECLGRKDVWKDFSDLWGINKDNLRNRWSEKQDSDDLKEFSKKILNRIK